MLLRLGALAAIVGSVVSVAAGAGFGDVEGVDGTAAFLDRLAERPDWFWAAVHLAFAAGALLWVWAFAALAHTFSGTSRSAARLALVSLVLGAAAHLIDSALSTGAMMWLVEEWGSEAPAAPEALLDRASFVLAVLDATWATVITFFHGVPFVLMGFAAARSGRFPGWFGWVPIIAGAASVVIGVAMFGGVDLYPAYVPFAVILSIWMVVVGVAMWRWSNDPNVSTAG